MLRLNFCVRDGNRWIPQAIVTGNSLCEYLLLPPFCYHRIGHRTASRLPLLSVAIGFRTRVWLSAPSKPHRLEIPLCLTKTLLPLFETVFSGLHFWCPCGFLRLSQTFWLSDQALDRLVSSSSIRYRTSTDDLSTLSSSRGLTCFKQWQFYSPGGLHA